MPTFTYTSSLPMSVDNGTVSTTLNVFGTHSAISNLEIHLNGVNVANADDVDAMLVGPDGETNLVFWSDVGGNTAMTGDYIISDSGPLAANQVANPAGTYRPTAFDGANGADPGDGLEDNSTFGSSVTTVNAAAPEGSDTLASAFNGLPPEGTWRMYWHDDSFGGTSSISSYSVSFTTVFVDAQFSGAAMDDVITVTSASGTHGSISVNADTATFTDMTGRFLLFGFGGDDTITSGAGSDVLSGGVGNDHLIGNGGDDDLSGGLGADTLEGGFGDDIYRVERAGDTIIENANEGYDRVIARGTNYTLSDNVEVLVIATGDFSATGNDGSNSLYGSTGDNDLIGLGGNDQLFGRVGNDVLLGGDGNDILAGGLGIDTMSGGADFDVFDFNRIEESRRGITVADVITDFTQGEDKIDLSDIDAIPGTPDDDAFTFLGNSQFSGTAGEVRYQIMNGSTYVRVDVDGDGSRDMTIILTGEHHLTSDDFFF